MDYRQGKCEKCGAEYDIPASFEHDAARCKACEGVVRIAPAAKAPAPVPAKSVQPKAEAKPSGEKKKGGGTLARLKAQRAAEAAAAGASAPAAKPAAKPAARAGAKKPAAAAAKSPGKPAASRAGAKKPARPAARRRGKGSDDGDEGGGRGRRGAAREKKGMPMGGLIAVGALVVVGGGVFLFKDSLFGGGNDKVDAKESAEETTANAEGAGDEPTETPTEDVTPAAEAPAAEVADPEPEPEKAPAPTKEVDPDSIDLMAEVPEFGPAFGTTDEEWTQLNELVVTAFDSEAGAAEGRARKKLVGMGHKAFPVILNMMRTLDLKTAEGTRTGMVAQRELQGLAGGNNFDWRTLKRGEDAPLAKDVLFNKKVVKAWATQWTACTDPATGVEYWIKFSKLDEKDPEQAGLLRDQFGGDPGAAIDSGGGDDDDLDVD